MASQEFIGALRQLEDAGQIEPIVALFAEDAESWNSTLDRPLRGRDGARTFWRDYHDTFERIRSEFRSVTECDSRSALEWESSGRLRTGDGDFRYRGVSILEWADGRIARFAAYFDTAALSSHRRHRAR